MCKMNVKIDVNRVIIKKKKKKKSAAWVLPDRNASLDEFQELLLFFELVMFKSFPCVSKSHSK